MGRTAVASDEMADPIPNGPIGALDVGFAPGSPTSDV
jgi:hypothetical protein